MRQLAHSPETQTTTTRPQRHPVPPKKLSDYIVKLPPFVDPTQSSPNQSSSTVHPITNLLSYDNFANSHKFLIETIASNDKC
uniref:Uncharacterized protein n=1 Tax=Lactuca sativa TaxID=4236 RepID=A0A9R1VEV8_LACSA|nr:hypothetical protein LSAT_V11C500284860 [Lactuca sativa]